MANYSFEYDSSYYPSAPIVAVVVFANRIKGESRSRQLTCLVDSGADNTTLPMEVLRAINAPRVERAQIRTVSGVAHSVELFSVVIQIGNIRLGGIRAVGMSNLAEPILGRDILNHLIVTLNGLAGVTEISD